MADEISDDLAAPLLRERLQQQLRQRILSGELPAGSRLSATALAAEYGTSAMPVRDALRRLHDAGLVDVSPRQYTRVASPDPRLADEIYPLIIELERYAALSAPAVPVSAVQAAQAANAQLRRAAHVNDVAGCLQADGAFHQVLIDLSGNANLRRVLDDLKARIALLEGAFYRVDGAEESAQHHERILDALARNDAQAAAHAITTNWQHGWHRLRAALVDASPPPAPDARPRG